MHISQVIHKCTVSLELHTLELFGLDSWELPQGKLLIDDVWSLYVMCNVCVQS